jgi:hypothetical protein
MLDINDIVKPNFKTSRKTKLIRLKLRRKEKRRKYKIKKKLIKIIFAGYLNKEEDIKT